MAGTNVIDITGDNEGVRIVSNRVVTRYVETAHLNIQEVCFGLMEKMYVTDHSLPAPVPLNDQFTTHWPRIPVPLKYHGGAWSLRAGAMDPFGKEFGSLHSNSSRVLVPLLESNLERLQASVFQRKKQPGHLPGPESHSKCKLRPKCWQLCMYP